MNEKCELCGSINIGVRNAYGDNYPLIGFAVEEYCVDCGVALGSGKRIKENVELIKKKLSEFNKNHEEVKK